MPFCRQLCSFCPYTKEVYDPVVSTAYQAALLSLLKFMGITERQGSAIRLTETGAYLSHLIEKEYTYAYLETLWNACLEEPWPRRVDL